MSGRLRDYFANAVSGCAAVIGAGGLAVSVLADTLGIRNGAVGGAVIGGAVNYAAAGSAVTFGGVALHTIFGAVAGAGIIVGAGIGGLAVATLAAATIVANEYNR